MDGRNGNARDRRGEVLLEVRDLRTYFHTFKGVVRAVDGVSFDVRRGEVLAVVGESGGGKSVTGFSVIRLIDGPGRIEGGRILFGGRDLMALSEAEMNRLRGREISMIFQDPMTSLNPVYTVGQQLDECFRLHTRMNRAERRRACMEQLRAVGISNPEARLNHYPHQFSGGMRQRVVIAIALAADPELIIADEPTTALDVTIQAQILRLMVRLVRERERASLARKRSGVRISSAPPLFLFGAWRSLVSAPALGAGGRRFESFRPDQRGPKECRRGNSSVG